MLLLAYVRDSNRIPVAQQENNIYSQYCSFVIKGTTNHFRKDKKWGLDIGHDHTLKLTIETERNFHEG